MLKKEKKNSYAIKNYLKLFRCLHPQLKKYVFFANLTFLLIILEVKPLTLTFRYTNGRLVIKTVGKLLKKFFVKDDFNIESSKNSNVLESATR